MSSITDIKDPNGPPSLPSYSAGVQVNGQYFVPPHPVAPPGSEYVLVRKRSPAKRFLRATFAALFLWILLKMSVHGVVDMVNRHHGWVCPCVFEKISRLSDTSYSYLFFNRVTASSPFQITSNWANASLETCGQSFRPIIRAIPSLLGSTSISLSRIARSR